MVRDSLWLNWLAEEQRLVGNADSVSIRYQNNAEQEENKQIKIKG